MIAISIGHLKADRFEAVRIFGTERVNAIQKAQRAPVTRRRSRTANTIEELDKILAAAGIARKFERKSGLMYDVAEALAAATTVATLTSIPSPLAATPAEDTIP